MEKTIAEVWYFVRRTGKGKTSHPLFAFAKRGCGGILPVLAILTKI